MGRPRLNEQKEEIIEKNFLAQETEEAPMDLRIPVVQEIPKYRRIQFLNGRDPGCALQFHYSTKSHPLKQYTLYHGFEHDLPEEVIDHLEACCMPEYGYRKGVDGKTEHYVKTYKYFFQCKNVKRAA